VGLYLSKYYYDNAFAGRRQWVRVYSEEKGANGRVVLEDVINILLTEAKSTSSFNNQDSFNYPSEVLTLTKEKIELAEITPLVHDGLDIVDVEQLLDFYDYCDDLSNSGVFENLAEWLNFQVCNLIIKRLAHLGHLVSQVPAWEKYSERVKTQFNIEEKISIKEWLTKCYALNVTWVIDIFFQKFKNLISGGYRVNTGELPSTSDNSNVYPLEDFALIYQNVEFMLNGNDNWKWLIESLDKSYVKKYTDTEKKKTRDLRQNGKSDDEIIQEIWKVTPTSNIIGDKNYQYDILKAFIKNTQEV
jgi:hypothetical protein